MPQPIPKGADVVIEYPSVGMTYHRDVYGVYAYDEYPDSSVLAGQTRRSFIDSFDTLEAARAAYPTAAVQAPGFEPPYLGHLPDEDEPEETPCGLQDLREALRNQPPGTTLADLSEEG